MHLFGEAVENLRFLWYTLLTKNEKRCGRMPKTPLLPLPDGLEMVSVSVTDQEVQIQVNSTRERACCPRCSTSSTSIHSSYCRTPLELPCAGQNVRLVLTVKKFFCREETCPQKIFVERLPEFLEPSSRVTCRLRTVVRAIAGAFNAKGGAQLGAQMGITLSRMTYLRSLLRSPIPPGERVTRVGIDDFAWKRGASYGTVIVNLDTHTIVDLLPDREAESVKRWLEAHQGIEIVSRDRGGAYADGATQGAPLAQQCADRWHLCANLGDAVERFLIREQIHLPEETAIDQETEPKPVADAPPPKPLTTFSATPAQQGRTQARLLRKWKRVQRVKELHEQGMGVRKIAEEMGLARNTVRTYLRQSPEPPLPTPRPLRASILDPYETYLLERWSQGCHHATQLFQEIQAKGFRGSQTLVRAYVGHLRKSTNAGRKPCSRKQRAKAVSPRALRWLLTRKREKLDPEDQARLDQLLAISPDVQTVQELIHQFMELVRERKGPQLRTWMEKASASDIPELKSFVAGIGRDYDAVEAGLTLPYSQGPVEGAVNKIKTHKRMMYGRARFPLLRQKMLHQANWEKKEAMEAKSSKLVHQKGA